METQKLNILIVEDDQGVRQTYDLLLGDRHPLTFAANCFDAHKKWKKQDFDVIFLDISLPDGSGLDILRAVRKKNPEQIVIMASVIQDARLIVDSIKLGASDYITKPIEKEVLLRSLERVLQNRKLEWENSLLREKVKQTERMHNGIVGQSLAMRNICDVAAKLKGTQTPVLLMGESGVGKEVIALAIHKQEENTLRPFIAVNCAAIPENLLESELFGHEKGAFTGASQARQGKFIQANGGDIFLDEIACMSPTLQAKLLRVLQDKIVEPLGSARKIRSNFRVIAATNQDIQAAIQKGRFRQDLYYRLQGVEIYVPPLRARTEDISLLVEHLLRELKPQFGVRHFTRRAVQYLMKYDWPGNVRELKNVIENILILHPDEVLDERHLPLHLKQSRSGRNGHTTMFAHLRDNLKSFEKDVIVSALKRYRGNKSRAAKELGISRSILYRKMKALGMEAGEEC
ncbi:MAG: sigma-54-dependent Fis family transcriptional regulator [Deltaproteobacteria bacterium]|nr:sigma-54-dependent Fis family transcriptional regulator [Deltaproteobacteria bacterium]MBI4224123.1 sigma-54-dependent Fis family transcriptional regulator [Deltaproteobacteria bacterium]